METAVAAHELTHLYLASFFGARRSRLPPWLDEGLAGMLQDEALRLPDPRDKGPVLPATIPLDKFLTMRPGPDSPQTWVAAWYLQAHSIVRFIKRGHIEASFPDFCAALRDGQDVKTALRKVYDYPDLAAFEAAWLKWRPKRAMGLPVGLEAQ